MPPETPVPWQTGTEAPAVGSVHARAVARHAADCRMWQGVILAVEKRHPDRRPSARKVAARCVFLLKKAVCHPARTN